MRKLLALVVAVAAATLVTGCAGRATPVPVQSVEVSTPVATPVVQNFEDSGRCGQLVGEEKFEEIVARGAVELGDRYSENARTNGGDTLDLRLLDDGGFICVWGGSDAGIADHTYAFSGQSSEQRATDEAWVVDHGAVVIDQSDDVTVYSMKEVEGFLGGEDPMRIAFGDGYWVYVTSVNAAELLPLLIANRPST